MKAEEILSKVKEYFTALTAPIPAPVAPVVPVAAAAIEDTLTDGTQVKISDMNIGGVVTIVAADGSESPAPAGSHTLSDGTVVEVAEGGIIAAITAKEPAPVVDPEMLGNLEKKIGDQEEEMKRLAGAFAAYQENSNKVIGQLVELCEQLSKQPTGTPDPIAGAPMPVFKKKEETPLAEKFAALSKIITQKK